MTDPAPLPPATGVGQVALSVADLPRSLAYYREQIGLTVLSQAADTAVLGAGPQPLLVLKAQPGAQPSRRAAGLYHFALLLPSRPALAHFLQRCIQARTPVDGASDHGVSEAIYLTDPDGHGIEVYRDRPRREWAYDGPHLRMVTEPLDVAGVLGELAADTAVSATLPPETTMGHIHLHVSHLEPAVAFYTAVLGFDLIMRLGGSAGFLSFGGYHHHLGLNTWAGVGAPPPAVDKARLLWYELLAPNETAVDNLAGYLAERGVEFAWNGRALRLQDPSANTIIIRAAHT